MSRFGPNRVDLAAGRVDEGIGDDGLALRQPFAYHAGQKHHG